MQAIFIFNNLMRGDTTNHYITIRELRNNKIVITDKTVKINDKALQLCENCSNLEVGDVLFSGTETIGQTFVIEEKPLNWNI